MKTSSTRPLKCSTAQALNLNPMSNTVEVHIFQEAQARIQTYDRQHLNVNACAMHCHALAQSIAMCQALHFC